MAQNEFFHSFLDKLDLRSRTFFAQSLHLTNRKLTEELAKSVQSFWRIQSANRQTCILLLCSIDCFIQSLATKPSRPVSSKPAVVTIHGKNLISLGKFPFFNFFFKVSMKDVSIETYFQILVSFIQAWLLFQNPCLGLQPKCLLDNPPPQSETAHITLIQFKSVSMKMSGKFK